MDYGNFIEKLRKTNKTEAEQRATENELRILQDRRARNICTCNTILPCKYHDLDIIEESRKDIKQ